MRSTLNARGLDALVALELVKPDELVTLEQLLARIVAMRTRMAG